jgi:hypothetical protein
MFYRHSGDTILIFEGKDWLPCVINAAHVARCYLVFWANPCHDIHGLTHLLKGWQLQTNPSPEVFSTPIEPPTFSFPLTLCLPDSLLFLQGPEQLQSVNIRDSQGPSSRRYSFSQ